MRPNKATKWIAAMGALLMLACAPAGAMAADAKASAQAAPSEASAVPELGGPVAPYRLGAQDKVRIITFNETSLTGEFQINGAGKVSLPLVGEVNANGLTTTELAKAIETALKDGYLTNPQVSVEVLSYRPFYILGEVNHPGEFPYTSGLTVLNAVATANGFTYRANEHVVFIRHAGETKDIKVTLKPTTLVTPGDTIRIGERFF